MYIYPLIRANRALITTLMMPQHPIQAVLLSETFSIILPLLNIRTYVKILTLVSIISYAPQYSSEIIKLYYNEYNIYNQAEICCLLLLTSILGIYYIS